MKTSLNKIWIILKILFGMIILYLLSNKIKLSDITKAIISMNNPAIYITLSFLILIGTYIIGSMCLYVLLPPIKRLSLLKLFKYTSVSWTAGFLIPSGDIISLSYLFKKEGIDFGPGLVINFIDKAITLTILAILTILTFITFFSMPQTLNMALILVGLFITIILIISPLGRKLIRRFILRKYSVNFTGFWRIFKLYILTKKSLIALNAALTLLKLVFIAVSTYIIFFAMGAIVPIYYIMIITSTIFVIKLMPPPFNFFGVREAVTISLAVLLYGKLGIASSTTIGTYIILFALNYLYALLTILFVDKSLINQA